jgi:hypothetical protein
MFRALVLRQSARYSFVKLIETSENSKFTFKAITKKFDVVKYQ